MEKVDQYKVALLQIDLEFLNVAANLEKAEQKIREAASQQAKIICLPEAFNTGYYGGDIPAMAGLAEEENGGKPIKVVANLPYYITTPIIMGLFESGVPIDSITIMVQKEVADRMQTGPGSKDYGALSLAVQFYATAKVILNVSATCFMPRPNVDSAVIKLTRHKEPTVNVADEKLMFKIIRASFNQRRKTLANGLKNSPELDYTKEEIDLFCSHRIYFLSFKSNT